VAQSDLAGVVNIGSGLPGTNREIVRKLGALLGRPELVRFGDLPYRTGDPMFVCADVRRLRQQTGWQPAYDIDRGLQQTVEWWREKLSLNAQPSR
jgi:nucleoside-diphosphate-sugar epimerase